MVSLSLPTRQLGAFWTYLRESRKELEKVNWPTRRDVARYTAAVLVFSAIVALILGGLDFLFNRIVLQLLAD